MRGASMSAYVNVTPGYFRDALRYAGEVRPVIASATTAPDDLPEVADYYMSEDGASGFGIDADENLIGVWSIDRGRGDELVLAAIEHGAHYLDCFDGYLPEFYARHGFVGIGREANWTPGEPDVVFMELSNW